MKLPEIAMIIYILCACGMIAGAVALLVYVIVGAVREVRNLTPDEFNGFDERLNL